MSTGVLRVISSMATRHVLAELAEAWTIRSAFKVELESVGGVDAARRVQAGESFDAVILAADAIDKLILAGAAVPGTRLDLVRSPVAIAVRAGAPRPGIRTEEALRRTVLAASRIGYSTGPSGVALMKLFERWGILGDVQQRLVQAPAGVPVGALVARGDVALGFQQLAELIHLEGIDVLGPLPDPIQIVTTFTGARCAVSSQAQAVADLLAFMASPAADDAKRRQGMEPARRTTKE